MRRFRPTLAAALASAPAFGEELGPFVLHHVANGSSWKITPWGPTLTLPTGWKAFGVDVSISQHVLMMLMAAVVLTGLLLLGARRRGLAPAGKLGHIAEALVVFIRDEAVKPNLGEKETPRWLPFFLTLFTFLLTLNLIGLIPGFAAATSNINFTAALAILIFLVYNISGIGRHGIGHYLANLVPKGIPILVLPLVAVIEFLGLFTKAFALAIRLFANMTAGHVLILSLLGLIAMFKSYWVAPPFLGFTLFIYLIEILVAFLQAYVFTLLSSLFLGMALNPEH